MPHVRGVAEAAYEDIEGVWRECYADADDGALTFLEELTAFWRSKRALNAAGSLSAVSKNSASQAAAFGSGDTLTSVNVERIALEALRLYEMIADVFSLTDEDTIYTQGLFHLRHAPTEAYGSMADLRLAR